jgi:hypothetical protein
LRRRAPARIDIALKSGQCPTMMRGKVHLIAGRPFVLRVVPPTSTAKVEIAAEPPLHVIVPVSRVAGGPVPTYHAEFSGRLHLRIVPIPTTGKLHVTVLDGLPDPCRVTIPVAIWPAYSTLLLWWLLAFLSIVSLRLQRIVADNESFPDILQAMWQDLPRLLGLLALGFLIVMPLRLVGWLFLFTESTETSD